MADRVAVLGFLNKRNGIVRDLTLKPGQSVRVNDAIVRLRACETTAPWENEKLTGAFIQLDVQRPDESWHRAFSGWIYKESPSLNVVEHPVYDVWPKSCAMTYPSGPEAPAAPVASSSRSSASRSGDEEPAPAAEAPGETPPAEGATEAAPEPAAPPPSAADNNAT
jgi:pyruvate/2-oxoglutarate dehydrogenase complex dihydrolipoamide acyltransferase (E2) component